MLLNLIYPQNGKYYKHPVEVESKGDQLEFKFSYNEYLKDEIKHAMAARWNPENKSWIAKNNDHNIFQLAYLAGQNPYAHYDAQLVDYKSERDTYAHQDEGTSFVLTRKRCILAFDTGTGKTLLMINALESIPLIGEAWWVGPKSALFSVQLEFLKWRAKVRPRFMSYDEMKRVLENWGGGQPPQLVVFDESQKLKTLTSQRSQSAQYLVSQVRREWKDDSYVVLMSGTPAPKNPLDWYNQCEIACPGFIREGDVNKFRNRLALVEKQETGYGVFPKLVTWWDDDRKCGKCGKYENNPDHDIGLGGHNYVPSKNEVAHLYERMKGLVLVKLKSECLDLPEKVYQQIKIKPSRETLRLVDLIEAKADRAITRLTLLRELSDGFQYRDVKTEDRVSCPTCKGTGEVSSPVQSICYQCNGEQTVFRWQRDTKEVYSPKEKVLEELLEQYEDIGRVVIYAGFTGSIEKCVKVVKKCGWDYIKADGHGWNSTLLGRPIELLAKFQEKDENKVAFIGQPRAAGEGLNLTASPVIIYYSNDFDGGARMQSEDRIHRIGTRGATIIDLIHLPTDEYVLENLKLKRKLQDISLGELNNYIKHADVSNWREVV